MLLEIHCDLFRTKSVHFKNSLNVVLGDANATNSIGKSTLLMVVDFVFGGDTFLEFNEDVVRELGHHEYRFAFGFMEEIFWFSRTTENPRHVVVCDATYTPQQIISITEYTTFLKANYASDLSITFRALVSLYSRVWGKPNAILVERPLHTTPVQKTSECIDNLIKTFDLYNGIRSLAMVQQEADLEVKAIRAAQRHEIIPRVTKTEYKNSNEQILTLKKSIEDIRLNLAAYAVSLGEIVNDEVLTLKAKKDKLVDARFNAIGRLHRIEKNIDQNRVVRSKTFLGLVEYFPEINRERLEQVETFHNKVTEILKAELLQSKSELEQELLEINSAIEDVESGIREILGSVGSAEGVVDQVCEVAVALQKAETTKTTYERVAALSDTLKETAEKIDAEKRIILNQIEGQINDGMRRLTSAIIGKERKSPTLTFANDSYSFDVYDDTGTGTAFIALILFDLAVFRATQMPFLIHDSLLFKNIETDSVGQLLTHYLETSKQSFIALDEIQKYGNEVASLLESRCVIKLSDDDVLYVKDWRPR